MPRQDRARQHSSPAATWQRVERSSATFMSATGCVSLEAGRAAVWGGNWILECLSWSLQRMPRSMGVGKPGRERLACRLDGGNLIRVRSTRKWQQTAILTAKNQDILSSMGECHGGEQWLVTGSARGRRRRQDGGTLKRSKRSRSYHAALCQKVSINLANLPMISYAWNWQTATQTQKIPCRIHHRQEHRRPLFSLRPQIPPAAARSSRHCRRRS